MHHVDPDVLALIAMGEDVASAVERDHIAGCEACANEVASLSRTALVGRSSLEEGPLESPSPRVWSRIRAELDATAEAEQASEPPAVVALASRRRPRILFPLAAAAAALGLIGIGAVAWQALAPKPATVLASAELDAFPGWVGSSGRATVEEESDGARVVRVSFSAPSTDGGYREVWLISSDATELVSLGIVRGSTGTFTIPDGIDITRYDLVDISEEPFDGDPQHSGDSIVRGELSS